VKRKIKLNVNVKLKAKALKMYSDNQKTLKSEDDLIAIISIFDVVTKQIVLIHLLNHLLREMCLFTLHNCCVPCSLDYIKLYIES